MKQMLLVVLLLMASRAAGEDPMSGMQIIRTSMDEVVYGTLKTFPDKEITIRTSFEKHESVHRYFRVEISPWEYLPGLSIRFSGRKHYIAYVNSDYWQKKDDYSSAPRFWGLRDEVIIGTMAREIRLIQGLDGELRELKEQIDHKYEDKTLIRPLSMDGMKDSLTAKVIKEEGQLLLEVRNGSDYRVWYKKVSGERLNPKVDSYTFGIDGQEADDDWDWHAGGLSGSGLEKQFLIPVEIKPKASLRFPISVTQPQNYKRFRARATFYPSSELINGGDVFSEPFGLDR